MSFGSGILSGATEHIIQTASYTSFTASGGFCIVLSKVISFSVSVKRSFSAYFLIGSTSLRSLSQSVLISLALSTST